MPSWNATISYKTSSSLTVRWPSFPLSVLIQRFLVIYKEQNSSVSLIYQVGNWYNSHNSGRILRGYQFYQVNIIAVATNSGNGTYSSEATIVRTNEGGKKQKKNERHFFEIKFLDSPWTWGGVEVRSMWKLLLQYISPRSPHIGCTSDLTIVGRNTTSRDI